MSSGTDGETFARSEAGGGGDQTPRRRASKRPRASPGKAAPDTEEQAAKLLRREPAANSAIKHPVTQPVCRRRARTSAVVPNATLWLLMGDTMATQYDRVSPESRSGRLNVSRTDAPREHFSGG